MRIRSTKPEFWRSERIAAVDWDARLVLKGLESYVDDNGVGRDDMALIVGDVFPRDMLANPRDTLARVSEAISHLFQRGLVHRYEHEGTRLLYLAFWESVQRVDKPAKGRFPRPDGTWEYGDSQIRESVARPSRSLAPGTGEQGNRGTGEQAFSSAIADAIPDHEPTEVEQIRDDVDQVCQALSASLTRRDVKHTIGKAWHTQARLLIDTDRRTVDQILRAIDWIERDPFWSTNVLSMPKLRQQYDQIRLKAQQGNVRHLNDATAPRERPTRGLWAGAFRNEPPQEGA